MHFRMELSYTILGTALALCGTLSCTSSQKTISDNMKSAHFTVIEQDGKGKIRLSTDENGGVVRILDKDGKHLVELSVVEDGGGIISVKGKHGGWVFLVFDRDGNVTIYDKQGARGLP